MNINYKQLVSGCLDWEFGGNASFDGLEKYSTDHGDEICKNWLEKHPNEFADEDDENDEPYVDSDDYPEIANQIISEYLLSVGENPCNYF